MRTFPLLLLVLCLVTLRAHAAPAFSEQVQARTPAAYWRFERVSSGSARNEADPQLEASVKGEVAATAGPRLETFPGFPSDNNALLFGTGGAFLRVPDPGENSTLDFAQGDTITIEAWVDCRAIRDGQQSYIIGKGRTQNRGAAPHNQNWALRLRGVEGAARVSFLFRDERNRADAGEEDWHRWTSDAGFPAASGWHHVVVTYTFGKPDSARAWVDGTASEGAWDMGGATALGPVVDNDEVWIGSSMGGSPASTFQGAIDEIAIYRSAPAAEHIAARFQRTGAPAPAAAKLTKAVSQPGGDPVPPPLIGFSELPRHAVRVEILEHPEQLGAGPAETTGGNDSQLPKDNGGLDGSWSTLPALKTDQYVEPSFAFAELTGKYNARGVRTERSRPFLVRAAAVVSLPAGEHRLLVRSLGGARLAIDGQTLATTEILKRKYGDAEPVPDQAKQQLVAGVRLLPPGHREAIATIAADGQPHVLTLEAFVGGKGIRPELGELSVSVSSNGGPFRALTPSLETNAPEMTDAGWRTIADAQHARLAKLNAERRRNPEEDAYWRHRHGLARQHARPAPPVPEVTPILAGCNAIDRFIGARLAAANVQPAPLAGDAAFLRRVTLDTIGLLPTSDEVSAFLADPAPDKRHRAIDRLLADPRWADRWTSYWQDALAENPSMLKGTLNNTGPFRWWIHEALQDNKPFDRFATELIAMEGSTHFGGTAGFALATQNDLPMAAKAQVIGSAFLAKEMRCARCHDAPAHPFDQADLFSLAAMLGRAPLKVPESSLTKGLSPNSHVTVSLKAGQSIEPHYPFGDTPAEPLPGVLRDDRDPRERLAAAVTDPRHERFAQVAVNRLWRELLGFGIVEPVDDWEDSFPSHPELLAWLGHELITHNYDLKHIARLILQSHTYQREPTAEGSRPTKSDERLFASPARRRMTAEQLVDSLFAIAGKEFGSEPLTFDPEGRQSAADHSNLGAPRRAWEFVGLSNERDRPALAKPRAQVITDVLAAFGWRDSRPEPRAVRDHEANVLQPALLANGTFGSRITRLSDDSAWTVLALREQTVEALVRELFLRTLSRPPSEVELAKFAALLEPGFRERCTGDAPAPPRPPVSKAVSWANHLHPDATNVILAMEKEVKAGDPPTPRLRSDWRERMEDALWALMLSPEFVHLP